jgi:hypothetical protein
MINPGIGLQFVPSLTCLKKLQLSQTVMGPEGPIVMITKCWKSIFCGLSGFGGGFFDELPQILVA